MGYFLNTNNSINSGGEQLVVVILFKQYKAYLLRSTVLYVLLSSM